MNDPIAVFNTNRAKTYILVTDGIPVREDRYFRPDNPHDHGWYDKVIQQPVIDSWQVATQKPIAEWVVDHEAKSVTVTWEIRNKTEAELEAEAQAQESVIDAKVVRKLLADKFAEQVIPDEEIDDYASLFEVWRPGESVTKDVTERQWKGFVYVCAQSHTTQVDWPPDVATTLWRRKAVVDPVTGYEVWKAWDGHNESLYQVGDIVWYPSVDTTLYIATLGNNHWQPDSGTGWEVYIP